MSKRITSLLLCIIMIISVWATALPTLAVAPKNTLFITADKTEAHPGETVSYTVAIGPVEHLNAGNFTLVIPTGLTFVGSILAEGIKETLGVGEEGAVSFEEATLTFGFYGEGDYTDSGDTLLMTFSCTVNDGFIGDCNIALENDVAFGNTSWQSISDFKWNTDSAKVTVTPKPVPATSVDITEESLSLKTGESAILHATVTPNNSADTVVWSSSNTSIATVDPTTGVVTAADSIAPYNSAAILITATAGTKTDTCAVTVNCAHTSTTSHEAVASTCLVKGVGAYTVCDLCGEVVSGSNSKLPLADHTYGTLVTELPATHTAQGTKAHYKCSVCGKYFTEGKTEIELSALAIPSKGHDSGLSWQKNDTHHLKICSCGDELEKEAHIWGWITTKPATRETTGLKHEECTVCHAQKADVVIPKLDHTHEMVKIASKAPTCTEGGNREYYHCTICDQYYKDSMGTASTSVSAETLPPLGHTEVIDEAVSPTCKAEGHTEGKHCSVCGEITVPTESIPMTEHKWDSGTVTSTEKIFRCELCGETRTEKLSLPCDVNVDGKMNTTDVVIYLRYIAGWGGLNFNLEVADANGDGKYNTTDVVLMLRFIAGWDITLGGK